jgi:Ser/Thr protein kinase RdoA (MazF antagonist)
MNKNILAQHLKDLNAAYALALEPSHVVPFGDGHIHKTYLAKAAEGAFILQQFNTSVFKYPQRISHNHRILLDQLDWEALPYLLPLPIPNVEGGLFTVVEGVHYRLSPFVEGVCTNVVTDTYPASMAAMAFGQLIKAAAHIPASVFQESIPDFHDLEKRFGQFIEAIQHTKLEIKGELKILVDFYLEQESLVATYLDWKKLLPLRLTHNDTKINNLIYSDELKEVRAVIDLDTLMGGYAYYDFGDLVRTVACTVDESSIDWEKVRVDSAKYEALKEGFTAAVTGVLSEEEIASLPFGGLMMTCIMGLRFLTDYLNGNVYYTIHYPEQNFNRSKNQMLLLKSLIAYGK